MTGSELAFQLGAEHRLQLVFLEPLFEEANRCRRLITTIMRALDLAQIGSAIVTLPGTGESVTSVSTVTISDWREAAASIKADAIASLRGGSLFDNDIKAKCYWRFAPETGNRIVRDLKRVMQDNGDKPLYAGHPLSTVFLDALETATPSPVPKLRTVRLESDAADADLKIPGNPLWRRAEPGEDPELAALLAADLAQWIKQCVAS